MTSFQVLVFHSFIVNAVRFQNICHELKDFCGIRFNELVNLLIVTITLIFTYPTHPVLYDVSSACELTKPTMLDSTMLELTKPTKPTMLDPTM